MFTYHVQKESSTREISKMLDEGSKLYTLKLFSISTYDEVLSYTVYLIRAVFYHRFDELVNISPFRDRM